MVSTDLAWLGFHLSHKLYQESSVSQQLLAMSWGSPLLTPVSAPIPLSSVFLYLDMGPLGYSVTSTCAHKSRKQHLFKELIRAEGRRRCFGFVCLFVCHIYKREPLQETIRISRILPRLSSFSCNIDRKSEVWGSVSAPVIQWQVSLLPSSHSFCHPLFPNHTSTSNFALYFGNPPPSTLVASSRLHFHLIWCHIPLFYALPVSFQKVFLLCAAIPELSL